jgi:hypothetical protein
MLRKIDVLQRTLHGRRGRRLLFGEKRGDAFPAMASAALLRVAVPIRTRVEAV